MMVGVGSRRRILVVDDAIRALLGEVLSEEGYGSAGAGETKARSRRWRGAAPG